MILSIDRGTILRKNTKYSFFFFFVKFQRNYNRPEYRPPPKRADESCPIYVRVSLKSDDARRWKLHKIQRTDHVNRWQIKSEQI